jgi:DNA-binding NarL/FixJ family response regulator
MLENVDVSDDEAGTTVAVVCGGRSADCHVHRALHGSTSLTVLADLPRERGTASSVSGLRPDVLVVEVGAGDTAAVLDLVRRVALSGCPRPPGVLVVADRPDDGLVACLWRGARGLVVGRPRDDLLVRAVKLVAAGYLVVPRSMRNGALESWVTCRLPQETRAAVLSKLTEREIGVVKLVADGRSNAEISAELQLTESTVKSHVRRLLAKLGLRNRAAIVILAHDIGLR